MPVPMTSHCYPTSAMLGDYLRAAAGFVPATAILAAVPVGPAAEAVLGGFAGLFALFGIRTMLRHGTRFEISDSALRATGLLNASIVWEKLDRMRLSYYSTRRDRRDGWMQLKLRSGWSSIHLDSRVEGFGDLVEKSARAAERRSLPLDTATMANLAVLGVRVRADGVAQEASA
jgi:hypothetical protein